ncbi:MAG: hypothetical protein AAFQ07_21580, partial [Chloroflexota bacterium]
RVITACVIVIASVIIAAVVVTGVIVIAGIIIAAVVARIIVATGVITAAHIVVAGVVVAIAGVVIIVIVEIADQCPGIFRLRMVRGAVDQTGHRDALAAVDIVVLKPGDGIRQTHAAGDIIFDLICAPFKVRAVQVVEGNVAGRMGLTDAIAGFEYDNIYSGKSVPMAGLVDRAPYHTQPEYTGTLISDLDDDDDDDTG